MELKAKGVEATAEGTEFQSHLYGIERSSAYGKVPRMVLFQSHLYGIESCDACLMAAADRVSIAPLWNWKFAPVLVPPCWHGVSIAPLWNWKKLIPKIVLINFLSFNRTFMELKAGRLDHSFMSMRKVSIAPLWNWKGYIDTPCRPLPSFQSHLYGIERRKVIMANGWHEEFQSHLYGIESAECGFTNDFPPVSIAPLWNWKSRPWRVRRWRLGFNRTFMELKAVTMQTDVNVGVGFNRTFMELKVA